MCHKRPTASGRAIRIKADIDVDEDGEVGAGIALLVGYSRLTDAELEEDLGNAEKAAQFRSGIREDLPEIVGALHTE